MKHLRRLLSLALCLALLVCAAPATVPAKAAGAVFPDVDEGIWYAKYINQVQESFPDIIFNGIRDKETGVVCFYPNREVKRGEFLKMVICAAGATGLILYTTDRSREGIHWAWEYYTIALEENLLVPNILGSENHDDSDPDKVAVDTALFPCTIAALEQPITRYEMAVILSNLCANTLMEKAVIVSDAWEHITDWDDIGDDYTTAVEQAYGKGLLVGYDDGTFRGEVVLSRAQAATVIERLLWDDDRVSPDWAEEQPQEVETPVTSGRPAGFVSFAEWLQQGHIDAWGNLDAEARIAIFGNANKTYFASAAEAAPYMESVTVPIWVVDKWGTKQSSTVTLTVHKLVAQEVRLIFQQIYEDPEQFPIYAGWNIGGARFSDRMRHAWGMAIDVNALYNAECNFKSGWLRVTCGYGWQPMGVTSWAGREIGAYLGTMSGASVYSISPTGSVVKAFADYGWGWGGSGSNVVGVGNGWSGGKSYDFMHFSVLPSGG